ncbi:MAG: hypothetical protein RIS76_3310 [Verrucomicrobiota bacterium]|jgi:hypothetical protein
MIKLISNLTHPFLDICGEDSAYDFSAIESVAEFGQVAEPTTLIFALDRKSCRNEVAFGRELLQAVTAKIIPPQQMVLAAFVVDFDSQEAARFRKMVEDVKGICEWKVQTANHLARVYDFTTQETTVIPAAELAPGMVHAEVVGVGSVWVNRAQIKPAPLRHKPFASSVRKELRQIQEALDEVCPKSLSQWEDGFRRDTNPDREIAQWKLIVSVYQAAIAGAQFTRAQRQECFRIIVNCTTAPADKILEVVELTVLSREEAQAIIARFFQGPSSSTTGG